MCSYRAETRKLGLFLAVGALATAVNYGIFWLLYSRAGVFYLFASWGGYFAGVALGFWLNASYTFNKAEKISFQLFLVYAGVYAVSLLLASLSLAALVQGMGVHPKAANLASIFQSTATNYLGCRFFVFGRKKHG